MSDEDYQELQAILAAFPNAGDVVPTIRKRLNISQQAFAALLGVSVRTIQEWKQGRREPSGPAKALLRIANKYPEAFLDIS